MIAYLKYLLKVRKLKKDAAEVRASYDRDARRAVTDNKGAAAVQKIYENSYHELRLYEDEIDQLQSRRLCEVAQRLQVPIPFDDAFWYESNVIGGRSLTVSGRADLRAAIRKEQNERWSYWELRLKVLVALLTSITGAAGALIGLFAILKR